jgi:hypothetical protein
MSALIPPTQRLELRHALTITIAIVLASLAIGACVRETPGYQANEPGRVVCACDYPDACYEGAAKVSTERGETDATAEDLLYHAQCACFMGSQAGVQHARSLCQFSRARDPGLKFFSEGFPPRG